MKELDDDDFIETICELHNMNALLLVYSNGAVKFLTDAGSGACALKETGSRFANLVGGQLHQVADDTLLNIRRDKRSELYKI